MSGQSYLIVIVRPWAKGPCQLPSWQAWSAHDPLGERVLEPMMQGYRQYARLLELPGGRVEVTGVIKRAVSAASPANARSVRALQRAHVRTRAHGQEQPPIVLSSKATAPVDASTLPSGIVAPASSVIEVEASMFP